MALACGITPSVRVGLAAPVPAGNRIQAQIVGTLTAPEPQPMHMPTDVAIGSTGQVYVADGVNHRVVRFAPGGQVDGVITEAGGQRLNTPVGLTVDTAGRLWIADTRNHRLIILSREGQPAEVIDLPKPEEGRPFDPTDLAVTDDGQRTYIVDNDNHRFVIRDNDSGALTPMGRFGEGLGQFRWPFAVAIGPEGYVYISEAIGARVQRVSAADRWAGQVGRWGVELGQLYRPKGVAVDPSGRLYVSDSTMGVIQVFGPRGGVEGVLTDAKGEILRLRHPMGMTFDAAGQLYVVELRADRVTRIALPPGYVPTTRPANVPAGEEGRR
jgi:DNA-binding beta-propeller fold protein YncE